MIQSGAPVVVRNTRPEDFAGVIEMTREVYPDSRAWSERQLESHRRLFPAGQFVAVEEGTDLIVGMAASLILSWDDYEIHTNWRELTDAGMFTNHDPEHGRTLYGAEVMVRPSHQGLGIGKKIYAARRDLVRELGLLRIRAGARLRGYHRYAERMSAEEYVRRVVRGDLGDPTLSFQLKEGFEVIAVVPDYLRNDPASLGYAAVIEWLNPDVATRLDLAGRDPRFLRDAGERSSS